MQDFHEIRFPEDVSWGSTGGPRFKTQVYESMDGYEKRNIDWSQPLMYFNARYGIKKDTQMLRVFDFFNARKGMAHGFRYKNWANYRIQNGAFATGDGINKRLPIWKFYGFHGARMYKRLQKIVPGSVRGVGISAPGGMVEGTDYTIDYNAGVVEFEYPLGYGVPAFCENLEFDEPVRFDVDSLQSIIEGFNNQSLTELPLIGVKATFERGSLFAPADKKDDAFFHNVRLILNFDDTSDPTTTIDQSELGMPVTLNGGAKLVPIVYNYGSGALSGGASGYASVPGAAYSLNDTPFSIEVFAQQPSVGADHQLIVGKWDGAGTNKCWGLWYLKPTRQLQFVTTEDGSTESVLLNYPWTTGKPDTFDYITVDRLPSGIHVLRINGVVQQTVKSVAPVFDSPTNLVVTGQQTPGPNEGTYQGLIGAVRLTIGRCRHQHLDNIDVPSRNL